MDPEHHEHQQEFGYYVGEEEDKGLLDPAWERQQKKTFTAWCNSHLRKIPTKAGEPIQLTEITEDLRDGLRLMLLLEVLSGEKVAKPERGRMRFHMISNINKALNFVMSKGVKLVSIGAEEICDGNLKMTLGMIWTIILRFAIQDIQEDNLSSKDGLLLWCQRKTAPYKNVNVQNFHMSFKDGLAFCALIHRHRPDLIDYEHLNKDNPAENLETAFKAAEEHLDIPRMLDVEDMVNQVKPDERAVMTYVSCYYHAFASNQQAETAAKRIINALNINKGNEKDMEDYENLASDLLDWMNQKIPELDDRTIDDPKLEKAQEKLEKFRDYSRNEKPPKVNDKSNLENLYNTIMTKLRLSNRPPFMPSEGKLISDINDLWKRLECAENDFQNWILLELRKLERLDHLAAKFKHKCDIHESWSMGKGDSLSGEICYTIGLPTLLAMRKKHEAFESDLSAQQDRVEQIVAIAQELNHLGYSKVNEVNIRRKAICDEWDCLGELTSTRCAHLSSAIEKAEHLDNMWLEYAKRASPFCNWLDGAQEDLLDMFRVHTLDEVNDLKLAHMHFKENMPAARAEYDTILHIYKDIQEMTEDENPYTHTEITDLQNKMLSVEALIPKRDEELQKEVAVQQNNEKLRIEFAKHANDTASILNDYRQELNKLNFGATETLELQKTNAECLLHKMVEFRCRIDELENVNECVQEAMIFENPHTRFSMEEIRINYEQGLVGIQRLINQFENQILMRDSLSMSEEEMQDIRDSFNHFDADHTGKLDPIEFKKCLISLGHNIDVTNDDDLEFRRVMQQVDPNNVGYVTFQQFLDFKHSQLENNDSSEQVEQSFRILAGDKNYITMGELRRELPAEQAEYCISRMQPYTFKTGEESVTDALDYKSFSTALYGESDL